MSNTYMHIGSIIWKKIFSFATIGMEKLESSPSTSNDIMYKPNYSLWWKSLSEKLGQSKE